MSITPRPITGPRSLAAFSVVCLLAVASLSAQAPGRAGRGRPPGGGPGPGPIPGLQQLDLSAAQREQIRAIMAERPTQGSGRQALDGLQRDLTAAVMADTPDLGQIDQIKTSISQAEAAALGERIEVQLRIAQILTPEQRQKARALRPGPPPGPRGRGGR